MKTKQVTAHGETVTAYMPNAQDVLTLRVGQKAINVWGRMEEVTDITARSTDIRGNEFVCYYTKDGSGWISASMKAGELVRTMPLTRLLNSAECDRLEEQMRGELS